jgi:hypothetical protein
MTPLYIANRLPNSWSSSGDAAGQPTGPGSSSWRGTASGKQQLPGDRVRGLATVSCRWSKGMGKREWASMIEARGELREVSVTDR